MEKIFTLIIDESINLELNVGKLYLKFRELFPEDGDFWWKLHVEEKHHASLIRTGRQHYMPDYRFPQAMLTESLHSLQETNKMLLSLINKFNQKPPTREKALSTAYKLENSAGELHFQQFMNTESDDTVAKVFQHLNADDKDHAERIFKYAEENGIQLATEE